MDTATRFPAGTTLRVAAESWSPHIRVIENGSSINIDGPMALLLNTLSEKLNFNYTLHRPPDGIWGAPNSEGHWNGMIGMVRRNEVDLALGPFILSQIRAEAVQYSSIFLIDYFRIFLARESPKAQPFALITPFSKSVWITILFSFFICISALTVVKKNSLIRERWTVTSFKRVWVESIQEVLGLFVSQDLTYPVSGLAFRILIVSIFVFDVGVVKFYSGALTSALAVKRSHTKFQSLQDLFQDSDYKVIVEKSTAITAAMEVSTSGLLSEMHQKEEDGILEQYSVTNLFEAVSTKVLDDEYALFVEETTCRKLTSDYFSESGLCQFYVGSEKLFPSLFGMIGQKNSSVMPRINTVIAKMIEGNFYVRWLQNEIQNATTCLDSKSFTFIESQAYDMISMGVSFGLLLTGLLLGTLAYFAETYLFNPRSEKTNTFVMKDHRNTTYGYNYDPYGIRKMY